uniref:Coiled-coil domain containing 107 n=1 Tax=Latimeria chalumnae TaxID=7897 RepID=H2ZUY7_LATCH
MQQQQQQQQAARSAMREDIKSGKVKGESKGFAFAIMPLYAIGVAVFAAFKFLKMKSKEEESSDNEKSKKGKKKTQETENQLSELEQRLAQTEKMLNSLLTQLDPLTTCVNSLANLQKNEIIAQLQSIKHLMKELDCSELNLKDDLCEEQLEDLMQSFAENDQETQASADWTASSSEEDPPGNDKAVDGKCENEDCKSSGRGPLLDSMVDADREVMIQDRLEQLKPTGLRRRNKNE